MLGALALLHGSTGEAAPPDQTHRIAAAALAHYGTGDRLWAQDPAFNAIFFRNLHLLTAISGTTGGPDALGVALAAEFAATLAAYAEHAWTHGRDSQTGLFHFGRRGPVPLLNQRRYGSSRSSPRCAPPPDATAPATGTPPRGQRSRV